ncbi:MAG: hypothetical protein JWR77_2322 [Rhizorhabdus sp.]|nr:hypothetical protein [Rhizorhabdus sp.]
MFDPFTAWSRLMSAGFEMSRMGMRVSETLSASNDVIVKRTGMIGSALRHPGRADHAELARMIPEKVEAFASAGSAIAAEWWSMQRAMLCEMQDIGAMAMRGRPPTFTELSNLSSRNANHAVRAVEKVVSMGDAALKPIHAKATSNAQRLKGVKAKG